MRQSRNLEQSRDSISSDFAPAPATTARSIGNWMMPLTWLKRLGLLIVAILLPATLLHAALPAPAETAERASLAGQLLIAAPAMTDPRFYQAVILMVRHDRKGAL